MDNEKRLQVAGELAAFLDQHIRDRGESMCWWDLESVEVAYGVDLCNIMHINKLSKFDVMSLMHEEVISEIPRDDRAVFVKSSAKNLFDALSFDAPRCMQTEDIRVALYALTMTRSWGQQTHSIDHVCRERGWSKADFLRDRDEMFLKMVKEHLDSE